MSTNSSALVCHLSKSRWPLKSKPVVPWALAKMSAQVLRAFGYLHRRGRVAGLNC